MTEERVSDEVLNSITPDGDFRIDAVDLYQIVRELRILRSQAQGVVSMSRPKIVCLCGSTRFKDAFEEANYQETIAGHIVLSVGFFMHASGNKHGDTIGCTPEQKIAVDVLHKQKIDLADEVLILNVGGYIGYSTRSELNHAIAKGKRIRYLE